MPAPTIQVAAFPRADLGNLVQQLTGMQTIWDGDPNPFATAQATCTAFGAPPIGYITLSMISSVPQGIDDEEDDPVTGAHTQSGWRVVTVQAQLVSYNDVPAFDVSELLRTRMRRQDTAAQLSAMNLAYQYSGPCVDMTKSADGRPIFYSTMDMVFTRLVQEITDSPAPNDGQWIATVTTGSATGATGPGWTGPLS